MQRDHTKGNVNATLRTIYRSVQFGIIVRTRVTITDGERRHELPRACRI
jgi:hypothetical protein